MSSGYEIVSAPVLTKAREQIRATWRRAMIGAAVAVGVGLIIWLPRVFRPEELTFLEKFGFDAANALKSETPIPEVQVIELDQRSFRAREQETAALWDRALHAQLVRKLTKDGARVIVFDVLFDKATRAETDQQFADAIRGHGKVALAATRAEVVRPGFTGFEPVFPIDALKEAAAGVGMVNVVKDADGAIRQPFLESEVHPSLPMLAARLAGAASLGEMNLSGARWLRYYGPPSVVLRRISYVDALQQSEGYFRDQFVFIGSSLHVKRPGEEADFFRTPFTRWNGVEAAGVTLLATEFVNLIRGDSITRSSPLLELTAMIGLALLATFGCFWRRALGATAVIVLLAGSTAGCGILLQNSGQLLFPWMLLATVVIPAACASAMVMRANESKRAKPATTLQPADQPTLAAAPISPPLAKVPDHQLLRSVGRGAYGEVWLARNAVGLYHAVKIIYRREFADEAPYEREFRGVSKFMPISRTHPGFVHILHVGRDDAVGCFYCIMEAADDAERGTKIEPENYVPRNLARHMQKHRRLGARECLQLGLQLSAALEELHRAQLIHRDIKPANIIFVNGAPKLADIGLVTDVPREDGVVTYLGTLGYIAPEGPGTPAADIYSLGKVLYEALTGLDREEFPNLPTTLMAAPDETFTRLNEIILKACEPNRNRRYQAAGELRADLEALQKTIGQ